ncbi:hypothetical protein AC579_8783 [Pseudocercospora musae]|uniref:AsqO/PenF-like C-terminal domain-containing protein n=1 Tax=Pseudocercospora musae TaxID=113226 RepID=A0A139IW44_9PEZI|nr:hypothetical protein AC579_8783 [Pseudocercospora musae]
MSIDFVGGQGDVSFDATSTLHSGLEYYLCVDSPASGIRGSPRLTSSRAPHHFACGPNAVCADELLVHSYGIALSDAMPDSDARFELSIGNEMLSWLGTACHDKVWGTAYISTETLQSLLLGTREAGISIQNGDFWGASCECEAVRVKAWAEEGSGSPSPPVPDTPMPERIAMTFDLREENGKLLVNITTRALILEQPAVHFGTGKLKGSLPINDGVETLEGHVV